MCFGITLSFRSIPWLYKNKVICFKTIFFLNNDVSLLFFNFKNNYLNFNATRTVRQDTYAAYFTSTEKDGFNRQNRKIGSEYEPIIYHTPNEKIFFVKLHSNILY